MLPMKKSRTMVLGEDEQIPESEKPEQKPQQNMSEQKDYKKIIYDINNFSKSKRFKNTIDDIQLSHKVEKFESKYKQILSVIEKFDDNSNRDLLFAETMQAIEDYIYSKDKVKCQQLKHDLAVRLLKKFVDNNEQTCGLMIKMAIKNIKNSSLYRRNKQKCFNFFLWLGKTVLKAI